MDLNMSLLTNRLCFTFRSLRIVNVRYALRQFARNRRFAIAVILTISLGIASNRVFAIDAIPQNSPVNSSATDDESKIEGTWRGDSVCVEKGTSCHDEIAVYRIAALPDKRGYFMVTGGKVVDGKEVVMGSGEWRYDSGKHTLTAEFPRGVVTLTIDGDKIAGTFILPDKTVLRRINLKKSQ